MDATATAPVERRVRTNGIGLCYLDWPGPRTPSVPPVVLLHGLLQTGEGMANLATHLAHRGRVLVPDLRGRGGSDRPATGDDPGTMADDVAGLIEGVGLDRPIVIGRLHGGLVAYHLAARFPHLVRGLVLGDTTPEVDAARAAMTLATIRALPTRFATIDEAIAFYQDTLRLSEARARHDIPHDLEPDNGGFRWRHDLAIVARIEAAAMPRADWDVLANIRCSTLLLRGQRGEVRPEVADRIRATIADCDVRTVLGARHDVFLGPGCEQSFGAIDLFLMRFANGSDRTDAETARRATQRPTTEAALIARLARVLSGHEPEPDAALIAERGRVVKYDAGGQQRITVAGTGTDALTAALSIAPGAEVEVRDIVANGNRVACVFAISNASRPAAPTADASERRPRLVPAFARLSHGGIDEIVFYHGTLPPLVPAPDA